MKTLSRILLLITLLSSCTMMREDRSDCPDCPPEDPNAPSGLYIKFKYDYNLQRADMFNDHVQAVTLYIYDEAGNFVTSRTEANSPEKQPLECDCYRMNIRDLAPGKYNFLAIATTPSPLDPTLDSEKRAKFRWPGTSAASNETPKSRKSGIPETAPNLRDVTITLDHTDTIPHRGLPLDTIWHGMDLRALELPQNYLNTPVHDTISLVRDTKHIMVSVCNLDDEEPTDIANYDIKITDRNTNLLWDNSLDEKDIVTYTPYDRWNTDRMAHAQFMTSRILCHEDQTKDARLSIRSRETDKEVINLSLANLLSNLRNSDDRHRYSPQEFLDRGYDYNIEFYIVGGKVDYINIGVTIGILSWAKRIQYVDL